ncbi:MAG TPA: FkbM family methyltransferase [Mucilaginibacter sp.]|jgi:FkbM family methyltransferase|nr:FkbM family methyltransferase [Mucilaginibacter sp.]
MKRTLQGFIRTLAKITGRKNLEKLLIFSAKSIDTDLLKHAQIQIGGSGSVSENNGERLFIENILPCFLNSTAGTILFDVGANVGNYALALRNHFSGVAIYAFEPVKKTFDILEKNTGGQQISVYNLGFSDKPGEGRIFNTVNSEDTEIASMYHDVFSGVFNSGAEITSDQFSMDTIDQFCGANNISAIDFLKIDVEGHELFVLKGASEMIRNGGFKIIQFEFNSHNVYSRVFLRDFYLALENFEFYRIIQDGLLKLGPYSPLNEIFVQQNLLAVRKDICHLINPVFLRALSA